MATQGSGLVFPTHIQRRLMELIAAFDSDDFRDLPRETSPFDVSEYHHDTLPDDWCFFVEEWLQANAGIGLLHLLVCTPPDVAPASQRQPQTTAARLAFMARLLTHADPCFLTAAKARDVLGRTALHIAARSGRLEETRLLAAHGLDSNLLTGSVSLGAVNLKWVEILQKPTPVRCCPRDPQQQHCRAHRALLEIICFVLFVVTAPGHDEAAQFRVVFAADRPRLAARTRRRRRRAVGSPQHH